MAGLASADNMGGLVTFVGGDALFELTDWMETNVRVEAVRFREIAKAYIYGSSGPKGLAASGCFISLNFRRFLGGSARVAVFL